MVARKTLNVGGVTQGTGRWLVACLLLPFGVAASLEAKEGDLIGFLPFSTVAPQDIAYDPDLDVYWVTSFLDNRIHKYSSDLKTELARFPTPSEFGGFLTGITYNPLTRTLLVCEVLSGTIHEVATDGVPTGRQLTPAFPTEVDTGSRPVLRGLSFDPFGDNGRGSLYLVETTAPLVLELTLQGEVVRYFAHPDDPDGVPAAGSSTPVTDVACIHEEGRLVGFYLTGGRGRLDQIRRLDVEGTYMGASIPLIAAGGNVSGILRRPIQHPTEEILPPADPLVDAFICVVDSNARFAILEGGEPDFREIVAVECEQNGSMVRLNWNTFQTYDRIEVHRGCEIVGTLPGNAEEFTVRFETTGVYELQIIAFQGNESMAPEPCTVVVGAGEVLAVGSVGSSLPVDAATDGNGFLYVTDAVERAILIHEIDSVQPFERFSSLPVQTQFLDDTDFLTGIAYDRGTPNRFFLYNATTSTVGILDDVAALTSTFEAQLPILRPAEDTEEGLEEPPDRGFVEGMTFDPSGDDGAGSLWLVEADRDWIYEIDLEGNVLRNFPHPYLAVEVPPAHVPFGIASGGISVIPQADGVSSELYLGGGALRDGREPHILRVDKASGAPIRGSVLPTAGVAAVSTNGSFTLAAIPTAGEPRLAVLTHGGSRAQLIEIRTGPKNPFAPTFLEAWQRSALNHVTLTFVNNGPYDAVEIFRDCAKVAEAPGDADEFIDQDAEVGFHTYRVRGVTGGAASPFADAALQVGPGALLERAFAWPARSPHQLARDPEDGSLLLTTLWPGEERNIYRFDRNFHYREAYDSSLAAPWQIDTLAVRRTPEREREVLIISSIHPVPVDGVAAQRFLLVTENAAGEPLASVEIFPPRPTNGFVTFPTGLNWDAETDTLYFAERNSKNIVKMSLTGEILRQFPHPAPPFQNSVMNFGLALSAHRRTLFFATADPSDLQVTWVREMTLEGSLTGVEVPLRNLENVITGIAVYGDQLIAAGSNRFFSELYRLQALPSVRFFVRGDSNDSGTLELTDVLVTLNYLFLGAASPTCEDALDTNDSSTLDLTDALLLLNYLFSSGNAPSAPFPDPGTDPTPDGLGCF